MQRLTIFTPTAALILALAACSPPTQQETGKNTESAFAISLPGTTWTVNAIAENNIPDDISVTMNFSEEDRISGSSGCNRYFANYVIKDDKLSMGLIAGTKMMCGPTNMAVEGQFLSLLHKVETFSASDAGGLVLTTDNGETIQATKSATEQ